MPGKCRASTTSVGSDMPYTTYVSLVAFNPSTGFKPRIGRDDPAMRCLKV
jgi:hypothetical protein